MHEKLLVLLEGVPENALKLILLDLAESWTSTIHGEFCGHMGDDSARCENIVILTVVHKIETINGWECRCLVEE